MGKIVIAGGSGFIGHALASRFTAEGDQVTILSRHSGKDAVQWDARSQGAWAEELEGAKAVINLAGVSISVPWNDANRTAILESRTLSTRAIGDAIAKCATPPKVWVNSSASGFYGDRGDEELDEGKGPGEGFLAEVCVAWERATSEHSLDRTRRVQVRTGVVLDVKGGALNPLVGLTRAFLGGAAGSGRQWMPWIGLDDIVGIYRLAIEDPSIDGPINGCAPESIRNRDLMAALRGAYRRPWSPSVPAMALQIVGRIGGPDPSLLLWSTRCVPAKAIAAGYRFSVTTVNQVLEKAG